MTLAAIVGGLTVALAVTSSRAQADEAYTKCSIKAGATFDATEVDAATATAAAEAAAYICDDTLPPDDGVERVIASSTASVFARAVAYGSIECEIVGEGSFHVNLQSQAAGRVKRFVKAYASAVATAEVCGRCENRAAAYAEAVERVSLSALAEVDLTAIGVSDENSTVTVDLEATSEDLEIATATAYAEAFAGVTSSEDFAVCYVQGKVNGSTPIESAECITASEGTFSQTVESAVARVQLELEALSCTPDGYTEERVTLVSSSVAEATARAIFGAAQDCKVTEGGIACVENDGWVADIAYATAEAIAGTDTGTISVGGCQCDITAEFFTRSFGDVMAEAAVTAYSKMCVTGDDVLSDTIIEQDIKTYKAEALSQVVAHVFANEGKCSVDLDPCVQVIPCVESGQSCFREEDGFVMACCDANQQCIKNNAHLEDSTAVCGFKRSFGSQVVLPHICDQ